MTLWQKLLMPALTVQMLEEGIAEFGGPVVRAGEALRAFLDGKRTDPSHFAA
ncbi:hypothetical protein ACH0AH_00015 [Microbacterium paludicola]|uniref:hypothetical protein n=1 Tax=Microbacterium paludicola TaxID=300019 RepID=UPI0038793A82